ncbi:MAG TPA: S-layer protein domain-containing protein, partial [Methanosarcina sp.]
YYDLKKNVATESLNVSGIKDRVVPKYGLVYSTTVKSVDYKASDVFNGSYPVLGFFAEQYVPLKSNDASKLAKLVVDDDSKRTLKTGDKLDLGQGYSLAAKQVDVDGKKVWLELDKDGQYVDDQVVATDSGDGVWTCKLDNVQGEDNVPVLKVHVSQVFQGAVDSIAQIDGVWLIDYANAIKINSDDSYGKLDDVSISGSTISISNKDTFTLTRDSDVEIGQGMSFKVADSDTLRYYPFVERTAGAGGNVTTSTSGNITTSTGNITTGNTTTPVVDNTTTGNVSATPAETQTPSSSGATPTATNNTTTTTKKSPGFGVIPGLAGLLSVVYLVRRNK